MAATSATHNAEWNRVRAEVLRRSNFKCAGCLHADLNDQSDVHHLIPRSTGGTDEPSNLIALCDGCHAAHHPKLAGRLARRVTERWALRLARWLDWQDTIPRESDAFGPALRLFGVDRFRDGQLPVVQAALSGKSILVVSPTGFGKTLCFQLPALLRRGVSVVLSPLKALMAEQVSALFRRKIPSSFINSDLDSVEKRIRYKLLSGNHLKLLYAAPERFFVQNKTELQILRSVRPAFLVIDEAHCVDQWGRDFRPEYGRLKEIREALGSPPVLAFTATAGREMQQRILESLGVPDAQVFVRGVDRPNIALLRWNLPVRDRLSAIEQLCRMQLLEGKVMIFVPTRKIGETLQRYLVDVGLDTPFYHSQYGTPWQREQLLKRFVGDSLPAIHRIICTSAFGMGLDIPNVRMVIHWQHPASVEDYMQEFGRAGRDGKPSVAVLLHDRAGRADTSLLKFMADRAVESARLDATAALASTRHKLRQIETMSDLVASSQCFRQGLVGFFTGPQQPKARNFSVRLLEWVFAARANPPNKVACCDACHQSAIKKRGPVAFAKGVLGCR